MKAREVMTSPAITATPNAPFTEIAATLIEHGVSSAPVVGTTASCWAPWANRTSSVDASTATGARGGAPRPTSSTTRTPIGRKADLAFELPPLAPERDRPAGGDPAGDATVEDGHAVEPGAREPFGGAGGPVA